MGIGHWVEWGTVNRLTSLIIDPANGQLPALVIWTAPWTVELPWQRDESYQFFEYACHEDNSMNRNYIVTSRHERANNAGAAR